MEGESEHEKSDSNDTAPSSLLGLFEPPPPAPPPPQSSRKDIVSPSTPVLPSTPIRSGNSAHNVGDFFIRGNFPGRNSLLAPFETSFSSHCNVAVEQRLANESSPLLTEPNGNISTDTNSKMFPDPNGNGTTSPKRWHEDSRLEASKLPSIRELRTLGSSPHPQKKPPNKPTISSFFSLAELKKFVRDISAELLKPSTWVGAFMFLLFQVVFCLTMGATITRPHGTASILGLMTKMAAIGVMFGAPVFWLFLPDVPALYPAVDLFAAPFMASIATIVDEVLFLDPNVSEQDNDEIFLGTYTCLASLSLALSGALLVLTSVFRLADLGSYLPFPVLCGFFSAAGVMTWMLAFKVDTNGIAVFEVLLSGDSTILLHSMLHHAPSVLVAVAMKYLGPKNPFYVVMLVLTTIAAFYIIMFAFGFSMDQMREWEWFYSPDELVYAPMFQPIGFSFWATPAPLGWVNGLFRGKIHWGAVWKGLETAFALSVLFLIRCSLHGAALKKNVTNLARLEKIPNDERGQSSECDFDQHRTIRVSGSRSPLPRKLSRRVTSRSRHERSFSEILDIEGLMDQLEDDQSERIVKAKPMTSSLRHLLHQYGISQFVCAFVGSYAVIPCVAVSPTMFALGAENLAPQMVSVLLLFCFYLTSFQVVSFVPKPAFSALLVLASIDMVATWFVKSYFKTKEKLEWLVVPTIVVLTFIFSLLQAVFIGLALSTFLFVASFFRSGVVKYIANGLTIRSTTERSPQAATWLDHHADQIQVMVLQNYLFFGNASSMLSYAATMFEEPPDETQAEFLPPIPKIVVLDLSLVSGIDTSAVDAFSETLTICTRNGCKLFLTGVSPCIREIMRLNGLKPEVTRDRSRRTLRFFRDLDSAIGKAEELLMDLLVFTEEPRCRAGGGFLRTLCLIDEQHCLNYAKSIGDLGTFTELLELSPGDVLYKDNALERGLFFIESGIMKIERDAGATMSRNGSLVGDSSFRDPTLGKMNARAPSIGRLVAQLKAAGADGREAHRFRVARVGPGWVLGSLEALGGAHLPKNVVAVTNCRLYHLPYSRLEEIEVENPTVVLRLYKLLSHLTAKRQEALLAQLGTLHAIMSTPARKKPITRSDSASALHSLWFGSKDD